MIRGPITGGNDRGANERGANHLDSIYIYTVFQKKKPPNAEGAARRIHNKVAL